MSRQIITDTGKEQARLRTQRLASGHLSCLVQVDIVKCRVSSSRSTDGYSGSSEAGDGFVSASTLVLDAMFLPLIKVYEETLSIRSDEVN